VKIAYDTAALQNIMDLVQEATSASCKGQRYDPYRGVKLSSYAAWGSERTSSGLSEQLAARQARNHAGAAQTFLQLEQEKARLSAMASSRARRRSRAVSASKSEKYRIWTGRSRRARCRSMLRS